MREQKICVILAANLKKRYHRAFQPLYSQVPKNAGIKTQKIRKHDWNKKLKAIRTGLISKFFFQVRIKTVLELEINITIQACNVSFTILLYYACQQLVLLQTIPIVHSLVIFSFVIFSLVISNIYFLLLFLPLSQQLQTAEQTLDSEPHY